MTDDPNHPAEPVEPPPPISIGRVLAAARAAKGLSVEDVAATTRIRAALVQAIERDDFEACGGDFYARAHVRTIARLVEADAEMLVSEFDREHGGPPAPVEEPVPAPLTKTEVASRRPASRWAAAAIAVVAVLVLVLIGQWVIGGGSGNQARGSQDQGSRNRHHPVASPSSTPSPSSSAAPSGSATASPSIPIDPTTAPSGSSSSTPTSPSGASSSPSASGSAADGVSVVVAASDRSWVLVDASSGAQVFQGILDAGQSRTFTDHTSLTMRFGNVNGTTVRVNGQPPRRPCPQTVCTVQFTPQTGTSG